MDGKLYKLIDEFNPKELEDVDQKLSEIQSWALNHSGDRNLIAIIDGLCRVANMYNMVISQEVRDGHISTYDPQDYIKNKLKEPYEIINGNEYK